VDRLSERVATFLAGKDGKRIIRRELDRRGLPAHVFDDVLEGVHWRALRAEANNPTFDPDVLAAWVTRQVQWETVDVLRGRIKLRRDEVLRSERHDGQVWEQTADVAPAPDEEFEFEAVDLAISAERVGAVRKRLTLALGSKPYPAAAAFCVVAMFCDGAEPADDCPKPKGGVAESEAPWWAAVFYSGRTSCFPLDGTEEDAAMRKRRSRALHDAKKLLEESVGV
jgi:hypothetical protein